MSIAWRSPHSVTIHNKSKAYPGYTLIDPMHTSDVWLIDMEGYFVHRWELPTIPRNHGVLLPNGNVLYATAAPITESESHPLPKGWGKGAGLVEVDWESNLVWKYIDPYQSHTFWRMENGNTMILTAVVVPDDIAARVQGGIPGTEESGVMWADGFHEVAPDGEVIWEWSAGDHLDPDIDIMCPLEIRADWIHANSCVVLPDGNILTSFRNTSTLCIIEKATGNITWRWGPGEISHQHDPRPLGNGNILVFDNGGHRPGSTISYSRAVEVNPATDKIEWEYKADPPETFYSALISGCQRLPNGNTLICEGQKGRIFEVTPDGEIVWEFINPFYAYHPWTSYFGCSNLMFRAYRYEEDYEGLKGRKLDPKDLDLVNRIYGPVAFKD